MKNKEWLKEEVENILYRAVLSFQIATTSEGNIIYDEIEKKIDQLDEPEKPVIPKYVAEQLEYWERNKMNILWQFWLKEIPSSMMWWLEGEQGNYDKLFDAAKNGYEVEEEKVYQVIFPDGSNLVSEAVGDFDNKNTFIGQPGDMGIHSFTEKTIKNLDPRYWAFAEEVTK